MDWSISPYNFTPQQLQVGQSLNITIDVANNGDAAAPATSVLVQVRRGSNDPIAEIKVAQPVLPAGATDRRIVQLPIPHGAQVGRYTVTAAIGEGEATEYSVENNVWQDEDALDIIQ